MDKNFATLVGGHDLEVTHLDGSRETVRVRQLPIAELPKYLAAADDEAATVELFCDKPKGWAASLQPDSFLQVMNLGEEFNLDPLAGYAARAARRREKLMPGVMDQLLRQMAPTSPPGAPGSP